MLTFFGKFLEIDDFTEGDFTGTRGCALVMDSCMLFSIGTAIFQKAFSATCFWWSVSEELRLAELHKGVIKL